VHTYKLVSPSGRSGEYKKTGLNYVRQSLRNLRHGLGAHQPRNWHTSVCAGYEHPR
jgi:hypothetical protein